MLEASAQTGTSFRRLAQRIRVPAGFVLAPLLVIAARPTAMSILTGGLISVAGLCVRAWASGYLTKNAELTTSGPYSYTRNPLYLGTFLLATGVAISSGALWLVAVFAGLYLLIYVPVMLAEADTLEKLFPDDYKLYSRDVPLFFPRLGLARRQRDRERGADSVEYGRARSFDASRYMRHREYRAAIGLVVVLAIMALKMYLFGSE